jgi:hypothetical protein
LIDYSTNEFEGAPNEKSFSYYFNNINESDEIIMMKQLKTPFIKTFDSGKGLGFNIVHDSFFKTSER